jgi:hypothetical protein
MVPKAFQGFLAKHENNFHNEQQKESVGGTAYPITIEADGPCPPDAGACYNYYDLVIECCRECCAKPVPYTRTP